MVVIPDSPDDLSCKGVELSLADCCVPIELPFEVLAIWEIEFAFALL